MRLIGTMAIMLAVALLLVASPALANVENRELRVAETLITNPPSRAASTYFASPTVPSGAVRSLEDRSVR